MTANDRINTTTPFFKIGSIAALFAFLSGVSSFPTPSAQAAPLFTAQEAEEKDDKKKGDETYGRLKFDPFIFNVIKNGKPYLQITIEVEGVIEVGLDVEYYQSMKPLVQAAILDMLSKLAYKKFRVGKRMDILMIQRYFQLAVDHKLGKKGAVTIFVKHNDQKML